LVSIQLILGIALVIIFLAAGGGGLARKAIETSKAEFEDIRMKITERQQMTEEQTTSQRPEGG